MPRCSRWQGNNAKETGERFLVRFLPSIEAVAGGLLPVTESLV